MATQFVLQVFTRESRPKSNSVGRFKYTVPTVDYQDAVRMKEAIEKTSTYYVEKTAHICVAVFFGRAGGRVLVDALEAREAIRNLEEALHDLESGPIKGEAAIPDFDEVPKPKKKLFPTSGNKPFHSDSSAD